MKSVTFENLKKQNYTMKESLRALKTNIQFCGDDICTIVVTSAMPNEGKSTVTMDLARSFSESGKRVLLIDTDMRKSVYVGRLRAVASDGREIYGLSHFLSGQKKLEDVLYGTTIPGLFMIFAGPSVPNPTEILEKKYFTELLNFAKEHFDYVLLDCPAGIEQAFQNAIAGATEAIIVTTPEMSAVRDADKLRRDEHVAEVKAQTGGDVFVLERELEIIEKRATDVDPEIQEEYKTFLRHLMSLCRKYEYELLPEMQEKVMTAALAAAGLTAETEHTQVKIGFTCPKETSDLNLFVNMTKLNGIQIDAVNLMTENGNQKVTMTLDGKITDAGMRCLLCQIGKEAEEFRILELISI